MWRKCIAFFYFGDINFVDGELDALQVLSVTFLLMLIKSLLIKFSNTTSLE